MAEDSANEDQWLYGDSNPEPPEENDLQKKEENNQDATNDEKAQTQENNVENQEANNLPDANNETKPPGTETNGDQENDQDNEDRMDDSEDDESDDDINVVIGDIKTNTTYPSLNIKRGNLIQTSSSGEKSKPQPGKFSIDEFESVGTINGVPAQEFNLDSLEDKPWRKPGADITDYFNYGFNEDTWRAYCERQKRMRVHESGAGLLPMNPGGLIRSATSITNDNSKYSGNYTGPRKAGPPPGRRMMGSIDVIGGNSGLASRRVIETVKTVSPKVNVIQVMTADRREYSRKPPAQFPDVSVPPPVGSNNFDPNFNNTYSADFYTGETDPYYQSYEPTQEQQWGNDPTWQPSDIKQLTPGPSVLTPINTVVNNQGMMPPGMPPMDMVGQPPQMVPPPAVMPGNIPDNRDSPAIDTHSQDGGYKRERDSKERSPLRERDRDRDRESRSRFDKNDRHRERSHRRERSRSRSRRHKSRSRSPSHRSQHKKKKNKRHDKSDSD